MIGRVLVLLALVAFPAAAHAARRLPKMSDPFSVVLVSADGAERLVRADDFRFAYFERIFYDRRAPRDEDASGRRTEVEDRRHECLCLKLADFSEVKFHKLRQIEILYPEGGGMARLRATWKSGRVREIGIDGLFGGSNSFPPRFAATIDGQFREFPLVAGEGAETWQGERLSRALRVRKKPPAPRPRKEAPRPKAAAPPAEPAP